MLWGGVADGGGLELRREGDGSIRLRGSFPYGKPAVLSDGGREGRPRKELFEPGAFAYRIDDPDEDMHLLVGHDYDHPLASRGTGTFSIRDTASAVLFEAVISRAISETSHGRDALALIGSGLAVGISPGFRIPPKRAVEDAETVEQEPDDGSPSPLDGQPQRGALIRRIKAALLFEMSVVTRPAYPEAQIEARRWTPETVTRVTDHPLKRWRA